MNKFNDLFSVRCPIIGVIHVQALPGTPNNRLSSKETIASAISEAKLFMSGGVDALIIENMHDVPYLKNEVGHEISTIMGIIGYEVKRITAMPCGIQILSSANDAAMAAAYAADLDFIRAEGFVYGHIADEGYIDANAGPLLRYRRKIGAEDVLVLTDIKKKHCSHAITADISLEESAKTSAFFLSDGLIISGSRTAEPVDIDEIKAVKAITRLPIVAGSGVTLENLADYISICDALIVGSYFKEDGHWANALEEDRVKNFTDEARRLRKS